MEKKTIKNDFFECQYKIRNFDINPYIEIKRSQILFRILNKFILILTHKLGVEIFSIKKNYIRTLTNIFSSWLFVQYSREDNTSDPIIPSGKMNMATLKMTIIDMMKFDFSISKENREVIANEIIEQLNMKEECDLGINEIKDYLSSTYYNSIKNKFNVYKYIKLKKTKKKENHIDFFQMKIQLYEKITDENICKIIRNIKISQNVYNKLKAKFNIYQSSFKNIDFDTLIWCLLYRYITLGSHNHQLAVIPNVMQKFKEKINLNVEVFASGVNHYLDHYCSLFYDIEKYFGSLGSFFDIVPISGLFGFNPPYENFIMEKGTEKIIKHLEESEKEGNPLGFLITIPIWDIEGKKIMEENYNSKPGKNMSIDYAEYKTITLINNSPFLRVKRLIPKNDFSYLDYFNMIYKDKTIQNTYVILMTNKHLNLDLDIIKNISFKHVSENHN
ncbi:Phosphorylated CTD interacting factor 1 WW domain [seawater metagenome]|uniref:Phosphorylated CTD interacting factor 1 WW domain n=1 Tax=seawater metagenome TaxID=1561972 RepID=A0A5E8CJX0_9ZZZZ